MDMYDHIWSNSHSALESVNTNLGINYINNVQLHTSSHFMASYQVRITYYHVTMGCILNSFWPSTKNKNKNMGKSILNKTTS